MSDRLRKDFMATGIDSYNHYLRSTSMTIYVRDMRERGKCVTSPFTPEGATSEDTRTERTQ